MRPAAYRFPCAPDPPELGRKPVPSKVT